MRRASLLLFAAALAGAAHCATLEAAPAAVPRTLARPGRLEASVDAARATTAAIAVGWSPGSRAMVDGADTPPCQSRQGLVAVRLPAGASTLALRFEDDRRGLAITLAGLAARGCSRAGPDAFRAGAT